MTENPSKAKTPSAGRRFGYIVAVALNIALLLFINNLESFDVVGFLTDDFDRVVTIINVALAVTVIVNIVYIFHDTAPLKPLTQLGILGINMVATVRMFQVFPFDFAAYDFNWTNVVRAILIISMAGIIVGAIVELVKLGRSLAAP